MLYAISWFLVITLLAIWSVGVWGLHSFAAWLTTGAGALADPSQATEHLRVPEWVALWMPADLILAITASAATVVPWIQSALFALPSVTSWLNPLAWVMWGIGFAILLVCGVALQALITVLRRAAQR